MGQGKRKPRSTENLRKGGKPSDQLPPKPDNTKLPLGEPNGREGGTPPPAEPSGKRDIFVATVDSNSKREYMPPPPPPLARDRQALTGNNYIPAGAPRREYTQPWREHVPQSPAKAPATPPLPPPPSTARRDNVTPLRPTLPTPSGRPYYAPPLSDLNPAGRKAIRQLEMNWVGAHNGDTQPVTGTYPEATMALPSMSFPPAHSSFTIGTHLQASTESWRSPAAEPWRPPAAELLHSPIAESGQQTPGQNQNHSSESDPNIDIDQRPSSFPPHRRKRKSAEIGVLPGIVGEAAEVLKRSKTSTDQHSPQDKALFENGMRLTAGKGHMNSDYIGVVLPLADDYAPTADAQAYAPWLIEGKNYGTGVDGLSIEIADFVNYMGRSPAEAHIRNTLTCKIANAIKSVFPKDETDVKLYGSDATALGLPTSDIDLMIATPSVSDPNPYKARELKVQALYALQERFTSMGLSIKSTIRAEAHIPLLEMEDIETGLEVDLSFEEPHSEQALIDVIHWTSRYGHRELMSLLLPLKHALNMRKLGFGTATTPYQGGVGSYILLSMVVVFMETKLLDLRQRWNAVGQQACAGVTFLALLKFWANFDYESTGISVNPPVLFDKSPHRRQPYIFEVRSPFDGMSNIAHGAFAIKHIKETLKHLHSALAERLREPHPVFAPAQVPYCGILGVIIGGNYRNFEAKRRRIIRGLGRHEAHLFPPEIRSFSPVNLGIPRVYGQDLRLFLRPGQEVRYFGLQAQENPRAFNQDVRLLQPLQPMKETRLFGAEARPFVPPNQGTRSFGPEARPFAPLNQQQNQQNSQETRLLGPETSQFAPLNQQKGHGFHSFGSGARPFSLPIQIQSQDARRFGSEARPFTSPNQPQSQDARQFGLEARPPMNEARPFGPEARPFALQNRLQTQEACSFGSEAGPFASPNQQQTQDSRPFGLDARPFAPLNLQPGSEARLFVQPNQQSGQESHLLVSGEKPGALSNQETPKPEEKTFIPPHRRAMSSSLA